MKETLSEAQARRSKLKIPRGWFMVPLGELILKGDRYKNSQGKWIDTGDAGRRCSRDCPFFFEYPEYAGVYIRREEKPMRPEFAAWVKLSETQIASYDSVIRYLNAELKATKALKQVTVQKLRQAKRDEKKS